MRPTAALRLRSGQAVLALCLAALPAWAGDDAPDALVRRLLDAKPDERKALVEAIVAAKADPAEVAALLAKGRTYSAEVPRGWLKKTIAAPDGKERPYVLHVPAKYDPAKRYPLVVELHGGVSRPATPTHDDLLGLRSSWGAQAEEREWFLAFPAGDKDATWWNATGAGMVLGIMAEARRLYDIDEGAVFATGFSDGGSGCFHLAAAHPTPFAGFVALNGHPSVAGMGGTQVYLRNLAARPIYAVNTDQDSLYPAAALRPIFAALEGLGVPTAWHVIEGYGHDPSYLGAERPAILAWMDGVRRDPAPKAVVWEGTGPARVDWLVVDAVSGGSGKDPFPDVNPVLTESRVRLGVTLDQEFAGPGVKVTGVVDGSPAKGMGIRAEDVIVGLDGADVADSRALRAALAKKSFGQDVKVRVRRGEETLDLAGKLPAARPEPAFDRTNPHGSLRAEVKDNRFDVTCLGVGAFEILLSPRLVDLAKPVEVVVNGASRFKGVVTPDLRVMLERWAEDEDRTRVAWARLVLDVPPRQPDPR